jgi:L-asparaginase II
MQSEILARVIRGETVESIHTGHLCIVDGDGSTVLSLGDPSTVTFFRSASKAFQVIPCITGGAADAFGFTEDEIALAAASHSGEPMHTTRAATMLAKAGFSDADLRCGVHLPFSEAESHRMLAAGEKPTQLHNNCSGKHAAMLALAKHVGADTATYEQPESRVQKRILRCIADFAEVPEEQIAVAIDGCAAPNFAVPVSAMARSFANLVSPSDLHESTRAAAARVVAAMLKYPELIGGSERLDTMLMSAAPGKIISKVGADGVWLCGVLPCERWPTGLGMALKVADGDDLRARPVVAVDILGRLDIFTDADLPDVSPMVIKNRRGDSVGRTESALRFRL